MNGYAGTGVARLRRNDSYQRAADCRLLSTGDLIVAKKAKAVKKAGLNRGVGKKPAQTPAGAPFTEQDPKRRLGNFSGAGEHPRRGGRTSGIVGQTTKRNHTDKHS